MYKSLTISLSLSHTHTQIDLFPRWSNVLDVAILTLKT